MGGVSSVNSTKALLIVDVQNDFLPGGSLAVPRGDEVIAPLNRHISDFVRDGCSIFASRDWHPAKTKHFKQYGGVWPAHCVQNTPGAAFHPGLQLPADCIVVSKGMDPDKDSYSAFDGVNSNRTPLLTLLKERNVDHLYVAGLATDYCVKASALDALRNGFKLSILLDAIRGVDVSAGDSQVALEELRAAGAIFRKSK
jgi:nicotinamidase/pyrazinamidase